MEKNPFFTEDEVVLLLQLVKKYPAVHTTRVDQTALKEKATAWEMITEDFNDINSIQRDTNCLKVKFRGVKSKYKWRKAAEKREIMKTGKYKKPAQTGRRTIVNNEAQDILESILNDLDNGVFEDMVMQADMNMESIPQDPLVEYDPDVDVDGLEETQPYLIEYLEEEIPMITNSPGPDLLRTPPKEIKMEIEKPVKQEAPARVKPQTALQQRPIVKTIPNHQSLVKNQTIPSSARNQSNVKNQTVGKQTPAARNQTAKNTPISKSQSATKSVPILKNNSVHVIKKHTPVITKEVREFPKPIIKKEGERSAKKPAEPPLSEIRRNPPREISKRRYTTSEINDFIDSESVMDDDEDEQFRVKKRRLTFTQQQKSLADSLGMEEDEDDGEDDVQVPTSTSTQKSNMARGHTSDEEAINIHQLPSQPRPVQLSEAQAVYFRDKNYREEKKEQREAEEHKLKMKKLWLDIRKTLLEINALESDNIDCEQ